MTRGWMAGVAVVATLAAGERAAAEPVERPISAAVARLSVASDDADRVAGFAKATAEVADLRQQRPGDQGSLNRPRRRRVGRAIAGAAIGAVGGAFAGGYLGAALEPDCNCDDPGFKGFVIGFPVGGVVGAVLGAKYLFR